MLKELNSIDEIKEYFEELDKKPMSDFRKARLYGMAKSYQDLMEREKPIIDYYEKCRNSRASEIYIISEDIIIVKEERKSNNSKDNRIFYVAFLNDKIINEYSDSFDFALIIAISSKYKEPMASRYISKMLKMNEQI